MKAQITHLSRLLRRQAPFTETRLWYALKNRRLGGFKFRRQYPIGSYIADFACIEARLIIELDGGQHARPKDIAYDYVRTKRLEGLRYLVLRFWNQDICDNLEGVCDTILHQLSLGTGDIVLPHPARLGSPPSPAGRGVAAAPAVLPLPAGEGWGEGVRSFQTQARSEATQC